MKWERLTNWRRVKAFLIGGELGFNSKGKMKIVVLKGSPRTNGNSNMLVEEFIRGTKESGH